MYSRKKNHSSLRKIIINVSEEQNYTHPYMSSFRMVIDHILTKESYRGKYSFHSSSTPHHFMLSEFTVLV